MSHTPEKQPSELYAISEVSTRVHSFKQNPNRKTPTRRYKSTKQVISDEQKYLQTKDNIKIDTPTWANIAAPPSLLPQKHYCDITGLTGRYKNPANALRFHNVEIYQEIIKNMPPGVDQDYLELRGANVILK
ncbi:Ino eighty subunit 6 [Scheffersomyces xylosifermentans]|uniref:Ino eighty subunit 6 n=1 Tax=Scheffersomyces xylosifermentans TaxID=1304137 RepID=UPI00315D6F68